MKKKGFTLVELLAVIAILAILVVIALPNILSMFNNAKKSSFETELKSVYTAAEEQWIKDTFSSSGTKVYAHCLSGTCSNEIKLNGRDTLEYYIEFDSKGNVIKYYAKDGSYQYSYSGPGLKKNDIANAELVANLSDDDKISISCSGASGGSIASKYTGTIYVRNEVGAASIGTTLPEPQNAWCVLSSSGEDGCKSETGPWVYDTEENCLEGINGMTGYSCYKGVYYEGGLGYYHKNLSELSDYLYYIKHEVVEDVITSSYLCFRINNTDYCLKGANSSNYESNKSVIMSAESYLTSNGGSCGIEGESYYCRNLNISGSDGGMKYITVNSNGRVNIGNAYGFGCYVSGEDNNGYSLCG